MLDWLIIGGGIHGALVARVLVEEAGVPLDRLRVVDPHAEPLARFRQCAAATGLDYLRSSVVHHLDGDPMSLRRFAERRGRRGELHGIYQRPSIGLRCPRGVPNEAAAAFTGRPPRAAPSLGTLRDVLARLGRQCTPADRARSDGSRVRQSAPAQPVVLGPGSAEQEQHPSPLQRVELSEPVTGSHQGRARHGDGERPRPTLLPGPPCADAERRSERRPSRRW